MFEILGNIGIVGLIIGIIIVIVGIRKKNKRAIDIGAWIIVIGLVFGLPEFMKGFIKGINRWNEPNDVKIHTLVKFMFIR